MLIIKMDENSKLVQYRNDSKENSLLPYTRNNKGLRLMKDMQFHIPNRFVEDNYADTLKIELESRNLVLRKLLREIYKNYEKFKKQYDQELNEFVNTKSDQLNEFRVKLMLSMNPDRLQKILEY